MEVLKIGVSNVDEIFEKCESYLNMLSEFVRLVHLQKRSCHIKKNPILSFLGKKEKITYEWAMWFLGRGKQIVKLKGDVFDHISFEIYMVIHTMAIAHYYIADKIVKGLSS